MEKFKPKKKKSKWKIIALLSLQVTVISLYKYFKLKFINYYYIKTGLQVWQNIIKYSRIL